MLRRLVALVASTLAVVLATQSIPATPASALSGGTISGTVAFGDAQTRAGLDEVIVTAYRQGYGEESTRTRADGTYSFTGLPHGLYDLRFTNAGERPFASLWWPANQVSTDFDWWMDPAAPWVMETFFAVGEAPVVRDMVLPRAVSVSGTLRDSAGLPIGDAEVAVNSFEFPTGDPLLARTRTAADGTFVLDRLPPGPLEFGFWADGFTSDHLRETFAAGSLRTGLDVALFRPTSLGGSVACQRCADLPRMHGDFRVRLERNIGTELAPAWVDAGETWVSAYDVGGGEYSFEYLFDSTFDPGVHRVSVVSVGTPRLVPNTSPAIMIDEGGDTRFDLEVEPQLFSRDFSGDDLPDVLVRTSSGAMRMYAGDGAGGWMAASTIGAGWTIMNHVFAAGDFSGDGHADVMARDGAGRLHLYRGDGRGGWLGGRVVGTGWGQMTAIFSPGDFSGDGRVDVLARDGAGGLWLYAGDGKGGWGPVSKVGSGWGKFDRLFAVGDFGGHGEANVMARTAAGDLYVYPASGAGGWGPSTRVGAGWTGFDSIFGSGDFDGDGHDDVMGRDRFGRLWLYPGRGGANAWGTPRAVGTGWGGFAFVG